MKLIASCSDTSKQTMARDGFGSKRDTGELSSLLTWNFASFRSFAPSI
jgi:hypothetical protein